MRFNVHIGISWWKNIEKSFLGHFTTYNRFLALKTKEKVLRSNGHRFWEVIFGWFFGHFKMQLYVVKWANKNQKMTSRNRCPLDHYFEKWLHRVQLFGESFGFLHFFPLINRISNNVLHILTSTRWVTLFTDFIKITICLFVQ